MRILEVFAKVYCANNLKMNDSLKFMFTKNYVSTNLRKFLLAKVYTPEVIIVNRFLPEKYKSLWTEGNAIEANMILLIFMKIFPFFMEIF